MNLNAAPTQEQLRRLLALCDDRAGHHILWVDETGEVHVSPAPANPTTVGFEQAHRDMRFRYETFQRGNEYVSPAAAADDEWVSQLFESLLEKWSKAKGKAEVEYVELW